MPSSLHEALVQMFRYRPVLAVELLDQVADMNMPAYQKVRLDSTDFTQATATEYRADVVVTLTAADKPVLAIVVEAQLRRDDDKRSTWPVYLATLRSRMKCPAVLLVLCVDEGTVGWACQPFHLGHPGWTLAPLALGPNELAKVTTIDEAHRAPELAVLSAMAHGGGPDGEKTLSALASAIAVVDADRGKLYIDLVLAALPAAARNFLEELMTSTYSYQSDFARRYFFEGEAKGLAEGKAEGEALAVLAVLDSRKVDVPDDARSRILACVDLDQLNIWLQRVATAESITDLFD